MYHMEVSEGEGQERVILKAFEMGDGIIVFVFNEGGAHIGAVALGEFDSDTGRTSVSLLTRKGHKDDKVAYEVAYRLAKAKRRPVCVVCGLHIDQITAEQMERLLKNAEKVTEKALVIGEAL